MTGWAFLHIPKTGGSALRQTLLAHMPGLRVRCAVEDEGLDVPDESALLWGHFKYSTAQEFFPDRQLFTVLRDPVDRLCSAYWHIHEGHPKGSPELPRDLDLEPWIEHLAANEARPEHRFEPKAYLNFATRQLEGASLAEDFALVGVTEQLDAFAAELFNVLCLPYKRLIRTMGNWRPREYGQGGQSYRPFLAPALISKIEQLCGPDMELYEQARLLAP